MIKTILLVMSSVLLLLAAFLVGNRNAVAYAGQQNRDAELMRLLRDCA